MRRALLALATTGIVGFTNSAHADITNLKLTFGGGCLSSNSSGGCTLKVRVSGFDFGNETLILYTSSNSASKLRRGYNRVHSISEGGEAILRVKNIPGGCFQVRTGPNGNELPDARSNVKCEK